MFPVKIFTLKEIIFDCPDCVQISLRGTEGELGILEHHENILVELRNGPHRVQTKQETFFFYCLKGIAEMKEGVFKIFSVNTLISQIPLPDFEARLALTPVKKKEYNYDEIKKNLLKSFSETFWKENKRL